MKLYKRIAEELEKKGIKINLSEVYDFQEEWLNWYKGYVQKFHNYTRKVNGTNKKFERRTLNLAKKFSEDIAKLLWTEKTSIKLDDDEKTKKLWEILDSKENSLSVNFPIFLEKAIAIGTGVLVEYQNQREEIIIDYIDGNMVIPFKYTNSYITGLVTINRINEKDKYYTQITIHTYENDVYKRQNLLYESENKNDIGKEIDLSIKFPEVEPLEEITTQIPRFQVYRNNAANNIDLITPLGISIYANALDMFKSADMKYDSLYNEFQLGRKRILVDRTAMKGQSTVNENGEVEHTQYFDENDTAYVAISGMEEQPVKEIDFSLRTAEFISAINADIDYASSNIGLGANWLKFDGTGVKTATEIISENSEAFRNKKHLDIIVNDVIYDLVRAICEMANITTNEIKIETDDSIIEDKETERLKAQSEVGAGLRSKLSYLVDIRGLSEEEATKELLQIEEEKKLAMTTVMETQGEDETIIEEE